MKNFDNVNEALMNFTGKYHYKFGFRVWTRGDYARYKEPDKLESSTIDDLWNFLIKEYPKAKKLEVRGEFGSDPYEPAIIVNDIIYINRKDFIQVGSRSILKNSDVWHVKS